jgi:glycosyltransferase involved in cell wall biosynthesis
MNIAIVSDSLYPYFKGGKEKRIYEASTRLAARGHTVTIYSMHWWKGGDTVKENGVTLHAISPLYPLYHKNRRSFKEAIFFSLHCFTLMNKRFDVIEVDHMPHLVLFPLKIICLLKGKRMIVTWHEVWGKKYWQQYIGRGMRATIAYYVEALSARLPDLIISVSEHTTKSLRAGLGVKCPIVTIGNGLDMAAILSATPTPSGVDVIFSGRLLSHKHVDVLIHSIAILSKKYPAISLSILGEGPEKQSLQALTQSLGVEKNVSFLGFLDDQHDMYRIMQASRVFVLPSTREGFGIAAIEANACGMPFITIDHERNAAKDLVIDGENGVLVDLDPVPMARAIETLLRAPKDRSFYRAYAEQYDWERIVSEIQNVYAS